MTHVYDDNNSLAYVRFSVCLIHCCSFVFPIIIMSRVPLEKQLYYVYCLIFNLKLKHISKTLWRPSVICHVCHCEVDSCELSKYLWREISKFLQMCIYVFNLYVYMFNLYVIMFICLFICMYITQSFLNLATFCRLNSFILFI